MEQLEIKQILSDAGADYNKGLERFMGNVALYHKFLLKFLDDTSFASFKESFAAGDLELAGKTVHTLKGTAGNLSLMRLYGAADEMVQAIRGGKSMVELEPLAKQVKEVYEETCNAIRTSLRA
ncbi:MAG: Hpt domain-containing protein [Selenomonas sp.]|uniref:Hpt domain-containing protein n=1 Tax=Selenomonas sp. TaxID=2053611 RepID=UPI0025FD34A2|nr:Hpt domain-containing protein [Selenomonas sp.]MCR5758587.1 Hpt domain-containing protein [Selenomonas sp.]